MSESLLFEIGVEELPASFVDSALGALPALATEVLKTSRLSHGTIRALGTPRRIALLVADVADRQSDLDEEMVGPPEAAAFKDGKPTKAAEAFAAKVGMTVDALTVVERTVPKPGRYVVGRKREVGKDAAEVLPSLLSDLIAKIPFRKSMRWGMGQQSFGRPIQWLVALFGAKVIPVSFGSVAAGRKSRGHRFLAPESFDLANAGAYESELQTRQVICDLGLREKSMMTAVREAAAIAGGVADDAELLVTENRSLVEKPFVVTGNFDPAFLSLPPAVIRAVARGHQRYFCVEKSKDELTSSYVAVVNTALAPDKIAKGMDRVMRARLSDAAFFYDEDKKVSFDTRKEKLKGVVFHHRLGSVYDKVVRIEALVAWLCQALGLSEKESANAKEVASLCKTDLVSLMVGEFPELQGAMGRSYARDAGIALVVADAIADHYKPVGADDAIAPSIVSQVVALADRADTLAGCFAVGLEPSGSADPFALRRNCIALLRTVLESDACAKLDVVALLAQAYAQVLATGKKLDLDRDSALKKWTNFAEDRLRGILAAHTTGAVADCVLGGISTHGSSHVAFPRMAMARATVLSGAVSSKDPWLEQARTVAKRLAGISKEAKPVNHPAWTSSKKEDVAIQDVVARIHASTGSLDTIGSVRDAVAGAEVLAKTLDDVFTKTLVNDPQDEMTPKRLELLAFGAQCMLRLGDFTKLG